MSRNCNYVLPEPEYSLNNTFGGRIYQSDFSDEPGTRNMASRIFSDWRFDYQCLKNITIRMRKTC